jgi:hypothetical protein
MWCDGSEVSVGLPVRKLNKGDVADAYKSYLGGRPGYYAATPPTPKVRGRVPPPQARDPDLRDVRTTS